MAQLVKCRLCGFSTPRFVRGEDGVPVNQSDLVDKHIRKEHFMFLAQIRGRIRRESWTPRRKKESEDL